MKRKVLGPVHSFMHGFFNETTLKSTNRILKKIANFSH